MERPIPVASILDEECVNRHFLPPWLQKDENLVNISIRLFRHILEDDDERWGIVESWVEVFNTPDIHGIHREVALGTKYLSTRLSERNEYGKYPREENLRQLCRAANNLCAGPILFSKFNELPSNFSGTLQLAKTNKISLGTMPDGVTGCPEALYQIRMFLSTDRKKKYIGRLGFNMHREDKNWIMSITNLQGIPGGSSIYDELREKGIEPFNLLVQSAKQLATSLSESTEIRAMKNARSDHSSLINTVCKREGIKRFNFRG